MKMNRKRRLGTIVSVSWDGDHHYTCLHIDFDNFGDQGFGVSCGVDGQFREICAQELCQLFRVPLRAVPGELDRLVGLRCWGLYALGHHNDDICGIENLDGERFTLMSWARRHDPGKDLTTALEAKENNLLRRIARHLRDASETTEELYTLKDRFTEWETAPRGHLMPQRAAECSCGHPMHEGRPCGQPHVEHPQKLCRCDGNDP